ncbi:MAG: hypothetical protein QXH81_09060 [Thermofilaceae archaeon]
MKPPFVLPEVDYVTLISNLERPPDGGHGIAFAVRLAKRAASSVEELARELERLATGYGLAASWAQAALARLLVLKEYCLFAHHQLFAHYGCVFDLSQIPERERAIIQQAIAVATVLSRQPNSPDPLLLVIEEGAMGATEHYLKDLVTLARRRGVKLLYVAQSLPPEELLPSFVLCIGDPGPLWDRWSRLLGVPLPRHLGWGEFIVYDGHGVKKVRIK